MLTDALVGEEEEDFIFLDGTARVAAEFIVFKGSLRCTHRIEKVARIERIVAEKLEGLTVKFIGAGGGGDVDDGAGVAAVLGGEWGVIYFEFFQRVYRRLKGDLVLHGIVQVDAIDQPVGGVLAL